MALVKATKPDDWQSRIGGAIISSAVVGAGVGAIEAFWTDVPAVKKEAAGPALRATANVIKNNSLLFAAVGGTFAAGTHIAECQRGKDDVFNGIIGGLAAGCVIGAKTLKPIRGITAGLAFAAMAALVDVSGQTIKPVAMKGPSAFNYGHAKN